MRIQKSTQAEASWKGLPIYRPANPCGQNRVRDLRRTALHASIRDTTRDYFRSLRAAEMAAWELTGGDYVRSDLAPHHLGSRIIRY
jgi:hypothetical protein